MQLQVNAGRARAAPTVVRNARATKRGGKKEPRPRQQQETQNRRQPDRRRQPPGWQCGQHAGARQIDDADNGEHPTRNRPHRASPSRTAKASAAAFRSNAARVAQSQPSPAAGRERERNLHGQCRTVLEPQRRHQTIARHASSPAAGWPAYARRFPGWPAKNIGQYSSPGQTRDAAKIAARAECRPQKSPAIARPPPAPPGSPAQAAASSSSPQSPAPPGWLDHAGSPRARRPAVLRRSARSAPSASVSNTTGEASINGQRPATSPCRPSQRRCKCRERRPGKDRPGPEERQKPKRQDDRHPTGRIEPEHRESLEIRRARRARRSVCRCRRVRAAPRPAPALPPPQKTAKSTSSACPP